MTFDIESLIDSVQGDNLDYGAFCSIFEQEKERGDGRLASAASQRSLRSEDSMRSLALDERDFQKFIAQYEGEEGYNWYHLGIKFRAFLRYLRKLNSNVINNKRIFI